MTNGLFLLLQPFDDKCSKLSRKIANFLCLCKDLWLSKLFQKDLTVSNFSQKYFGKIGPTHDIFGTSTIAIYENDTVAKVPGNFSRINNVQSFRALSIHCIG